MKKKFILKDYNKTHICDDDCNNYSYTNGDDLLSHFFNMKFECETGEIIFLVCHIFIRWEDNCGQWPEYHFLYKNMNSDKYFDVDFNFDKLCR